MVIGRNLAVLQACDGSDPDQRERRCVALMLSRWDGGVILEAWEAELFALGGQLFQLIGLGDRQAGALDDDPLIAAKLVQ